MKIDTTTLRNKAEDALRSCLEGVPFLRVMRVEREQASLTERPDLVLEVRRPGGSQVVIVEVRSSGEPRFARQAMAQLSRYREGRPGTYGVLVAPYVSPASAEICMSEGIGYVDLSGNCRLCFGDVYVEREGKPNKYAEKRDLRTLYSPRASRILRVLLINGDRSWRVTDLAKEAGVSLGLVSSVRRHLGDREWTRAKRDGFVLSEPEELLTEWSQNYSYRQNNVLDFYSLVEPMMTEIGFESACSRLGIQYAFTGFSAAARIAPVVTYQRVFAYVSGRVEEVASELELREVKSGPNVTLLVPYDEGVFYGVRQVGGVPTVSDVQAYLDVLGVRGRGEEAAIAILNQSIRSRW